MTAAARPGRRGGRLPLLALALALPAPALAQDRPSDRPSDQDIFGPPKAEPPAKPAPGAPPAAPAPAEREPAATPPPPSTPESARDEALLGQRDAATKLSEEVAPEDPLKVGGMFYLRAQSSASEGQAPEDWSFAAPSLVDVFMDARPNDRVRGLIVGRLSFDPALPPNESQETQAGFGSPETSGSTMGSAPLSSLFARRTRGPTAALDQMWLRFDVKHTVFVTAGRQHVRWGTGRFWAPTDYLHTRRRNPLDVFDARTGTSMLKLHLPWEARGWNFYAYGLAEDVDATSTVGDVAGAARAEVVLGTTELGAGALVERNRKPKLGFDVSTGIWDFDLYGELALRYGSEIDRITFDRERYDRQVAMPAPGSLDDLRAAVDAIYPARRASGLKAQAVGGVTYSRKYHDNDVWSLGAEYFYNPLGYSSPDVYPGLVLPRTVPLVDPATFFYLGRHYAAVFLAVPAPYSWDLTTFTLSTLGNLSDKSFITRLDYSLLMLTHLRFEAFVAVRYGTEEGEFRFGASGFTISGRNLSRAPGLVDLGVALRVNL
jgi:hypothetical protein